MKKAVIVFIHMGYWALYGLLLLFLLVATGISRPEEQPAPGGLLEPLFLSPFGIVMIVPAALSFYSSYFLLFPNFLSRRMIFTLVVSGLASSLLAAVVAELVISIAFGPGLLFEEGWNPAVGMLVVMTLLGLVHGSIALVIRGFIAWYGELRIREALNRKNFEMELALVKSQLDPHFLFNTIHSIDILIEKDAAKASAYLNKLSEIMRFMLYETKTEKIPLSKELDYISRYIDLQKIRTPNPDYVSYTVSGNPGGLLIAPMLFIPFIENAFTHSESRKKENAVKIAFEISERIVFRCENSYTASQEKKDAGGLGNTLIRKRLDLLYPGTHTLEVNDANGNYRVTLILEK